jgi:hypothetical protein
MKMTAALSIIIVSMLYSLANAQYIQDGSYSCNGSDP